MSTQELPVSPQAAASPALAGAGTRSGWQEFTVTWWARFVAARWLWVPLLIFVVTRLGILLVAYVSAPLIVEPADSGYHIRPDNAVLDVLGSRWDSGFYLSIAREGYRFGVPEGQFSSVPFFPLLPVLIAGGKLLLGDPVLAGVLVANLALMGASILFYRLVDEEWGSVIADRAVWYMLIFPTSFFGSAIYTESLFLLGATGALYLFRRGRWEFAGLAGALAAFSRFVGIIVAPLLLLEWWMARNRQGPPISRAAVVAALIVPLGTLGYMTYLYLAFGDPLAFAHASTEWDRSVRPPLEAVANILRRPDEGWRVALLAGRIPIDDGIDLLAALVFALLGLILLIQRRWSEGALVLCGVLLPLNFGLLMSLRRYVWVLFPAFSLLARWGRHPWVDRAITTVSLLFLGLFTAMFTNWFWVA
ncbi:MAG: mannosyltransferase family protein [Anaerolineae bacterium]